MQCSCLGLLGHHQNVHFFIFYELETDINTARGHLVSVSGRSALQVRGTWGDMFESDITSGLERVAHHHELTSSTLRRRFCWPTVLVVPYELFPWFWVTLWRLWGISIRKEFPHHWDDPNPVVL